MRKAWEEGASSGQVGTFFCELLRTDGRKGLRTWVAVRNHRQRGRSMAMESLMKSSSTGDDIWMSRYSTSWIVHLDASFKYSRHTRGRPARGVSHAQFPCSTTS